VLALVARPRLAYGSLTLHPGQTVQASPAIKAEQQETRACKIQSHFVSLGAGFLDPWAAWEPPGLLIGCSARVFERFGSIGDRQGGIVRKIPLRPAAEYEDEYYILYKRVL